MSLSRIAWRKPLLRPSLIHRNSALSSSLHSSSRRPRTETLPTHLSPEKTRALISLYHQSKDFVSPSNLSDKIDEVFAKDFYANSAMFAGYGELRAMVEERKAAPVVGNAQTREQIMTQTWSVGPTAKREQMVIDALYGVDEGMPGLDSLLDAEWKIRRATEEDRAAGRSW